MYRSNTIRGQLFKPSTLALAYDWNKYSNASSMPSVNYHNDLGGTVSPALPQNERGALLTSPLQHGRKVGQLGTYDVPMSTWTFLQPTDKCDVQLMPPPKAKYYQRHTKKEWDISSQCHMDIMYRKRFLIYVESLIMCIIVYLILPKEKSYSGLHGTDGINVCIPKGRNEFYA